MRDKMAGGGKKDCLVRETHNWYCKPGKTEGSWNFQKFYEKREDIWNHRAREKHSGSSVVRFSQTDPKGKGENMERIFGIEKGIRVPDGTVVYLLLNAKDTTGKLPGGLLEDFSLAAGEIKPGSGPRFTSCLW